MLTVSTLPSLDRHPVPVEVKMTEPAVFVKPDHGTQLPSAGKENPFPMNVVPPLPKPPSTAMQ